MQRDLRLDIMRGWLQLTIFASHALGSWIGTWLIFGVWGLSDSSEQFVFLSGLTLGSVFENKRSRLGWRAALHDMLRRTAGLYRTHLILLAGFLLIVLLCRHTPALADQVAELRWSAWFDHPLLATAAALGLAYQPAYMDILPIFILSMLALPFFAAISERLGTLALLIPVGAYAATHAMGLVLPHVGEAPGFNVLAWQILFLTGAWLGRAGRRGEWALSRRLPLALLAAALVLLGIVLRLRQHGFLDWPVPDLGAWAEKPELGPLRMFHALALSYLVARFVPKEAAWMHPAALRGGRGHRAEQPQRVLRRAVPVLGLHRSVQPSPLFRRPRSRSDRDRLRAAGRARRVRGQGETAGKAGHQPRTVRSQPAGSGSGTSVRATGRRRVGHDRPCQASAR